MLSKIFVVAGEASSDTHGSNLVHELYKKVKDLKFFGVCGERMRQAGVEAVVKSSELSIMGITEAVKRIPDVLKIIKKLKSVIQKEKPDLAVLMDFPDFNLKIAKFLKKEKIPIIYYISPQVWAWRKSRVREIKKYVDKMLVVFPFEVDFYRKNKVNVEFIGHPVLDEIDFSEGNDENISKETIGLFPGSRTFEIENLLPEMLKAGRIIKRHFSKVKFIIPAASTVSVDLIEKILADFKDLNVRVLKESYYEAIRSSYVVAVASGTASLEVGLFGKPMVIVYKGSFFSYLVYKMFVNVKHIGLPNILLGQKLVPELIQNDVNGENISKSLMFYLNDKEKYRKTKEKLTALREILGSKGASKRAADIIMQFSGGV